MSLPTGTLTFVMTDVEGSTALWESDSDAMSNALACHRAVIADAVARHHGARPIEQGEGDSTVSAFARPSDALAACVEAQSTISDQTGLKVRIAVHTGEAELGDSTYYGPALNRCARLRASAHGGQILVSQATWELVVDAALPGVTMLDLGVHRLRDLGRPEHIYQIIHADLPRTFPALRTLDSTPNNLPIQPTSFIGREPETADVGRLLSDSRLVTLTGSGGVGKTRLALHIAAETLDEHPDGVWYVDLAPVSDPELVPRVVLNALAISEVPDRPVLDTLLDQTAQRNLLVLLDNCEHLLELCARVADRLLHRCPHVVVLATSREPLGVQGETTYRVPSMSLPDQTESTTATLGTYDAVRLFVDRALRVRPNFTVTNQSAPAVAEICHRLDGLPLAIELAAARTRMLSVEQIRDGLDDRFRLLTGGSRMAMPRQQTLLASVEWSHELLSEPERMLMRRLAAFAASFTLDAAECVCASDGIEKLELLELLTQLVDKSLVQVEERPGPTRYRLLETVRQFARDRFVAAGEVEAVRRRHLAFYVQLVERAAPELVRTDQLEWLALLDEEYGNVRSALEWAHAIGDHGSLARLVASLTFYWEPRGQFREGDAWFDRATTVDGSVAPALVARCLWGRVHLGIYGGGLGLDVAEQAEGALDVARQAGDRSTTARALIALSLIKGSFKEMCEEAVSLARDSDDDWALIEASQFLAFDDIQGGRLDLGLKTLDDTEDALARTGNRAHVAFHWEGKGLVASARADNETALLCNAKALDAARSIGEPYAMGTCALRLAQTQAKAGDKSAWQDAVESLREAAERGNRYSVVWLSLVLARSAEASGDIPAAIAHLDAAERVADGDRPLERSVSQVRASVLLRTGNIAEARRLVEDGLAEARSAGSRTKIAEHLGLLGAVEEIEGELERAEALHHEALTIRAEHGLWMGVIESLEALGALALLSESRAEGARLFGATTAARKRGGLALRDLPSEIDEEAFAEGEAMSLEHAVTYVQRARGSRRRPSRGWASLTPTEMEVVKLATQGLTNPQIGERLFISRGTVRTHLSHVFAKLGISGRTELAVVATRQGVSG